MAIIVSGVEKQAKCATGAADRWFYLLDCCRLSGCLEADRRIARINKHIKEHSKCRCVADGQTFWPVNIIPGKARPDIQSSI